MLHHWGGASVGRSKFAVSALLALVAPLTVWTTESLSAEPPSPAIPLVERALQAELTGDNAARRRLLQQAIEIDAEFAPARWHSGFVREYGQWLSIEEAVKRAAADPLRRQYRAERERAEDTVAGQLKLAKWCQEKRLPEEALAHLTRVVALEPNHAAAHALLGHQRTDSGWFSADEIRRRRELDARWTPKIKSIRKRLESRTASVRQAATNELLAIKDPEAIVFLGQLLLGASPETDEQLVDGLAGMDGPESTTALLHMAVGASTRGVREQAADKLKMREPESYIPVLMAAMYQPSHVKHEWRDAGKGVLIWRRSLSIQRQAATDMVVDDWIHQTTVTGNAAQPLLGAKPKLAAATLKLQGLSAEEFDKLPQASHLAIGPFSLQTETVDRRVKESAAKLNERVVAVLAIATGERFADEPQAWWNWWNGTPSAGVVKAAYRTGRQIYSSSTAADFLYVDPCPDQVQIFAQVREGSGSGVYYGVGCCLSSNTSIHTLDGLRPIETLRVGDRVLSQDSKSGELAFKSVLEVTFRPPAAVTEISCGDEPIRSTPGHPFWCGGAGWKAARELTGGSRLHGPAGAIPVKTVQEEGSAAVYNLVVADFGTFFVGRQGILVHDATIPQTTAGSLPGMAGTLQEPKQ